MSRKFDGSGSQELKVSSAVLNAEPMTMFVWFNIAVSASGALISLANTDGSAGMWRLNISNFLEIWAAKESNAGVFNYALSNSNFMLGMWHNATAVFGDDNHRASYLNGSGKGIDTTGIADPTIVNTRVGRHAEASSINGRIAHAAIWNVALSDYEILLLGRHRVHPRLIRPGNLKAYWPLFGTQSPEIDLVGGNNLTVTGATEAEHLILNDYRSPADYLRYPRPRRRFGTAGVNAISAMIQSYRQRRTG